MQIAITLIFIMLAIAIFLLIAFLMATFRFMPYIAGAVLAIAPLAYMEESGIDFEFYSRIPIWGRYLLVAGIIEILIFILMQYGSTRFASSVFLDSFFICIIPTVLELHASTYLQAIIGTICLSLALFIAVKLCIDRQRSDTEGGNWVTRIIAGILFGIGIYMFVFTLIEFMWGHFLLNNHEIIALIFGAIAGIIFMLEDMRRNEV